MAEVVRLGTRGSALARWQADWVADRLRASGVQVELVLISTEGDTRSGPIGGLGGQGVFTKEIQRALLDDRIDLAVHSLKDLPTEPVPGLQLAAVPQRESPLDVLITSSGQTLEQLPAGSRVGTGSMRRQAQLLFARADLEVQGIRGNVDTRLRQLDENRFDAIVLAQAGLQRLGLAARITQVLDPGLLLPAIGQGALGLEIRCDDEATRQCIAALDHAPSHQSVLAERTLLAALHGGCLAPIGAWARVEGDQLTLDAVVLDAQGSQRLATQVVGVACEPETLGRQAAQQLLQQGAASLIARSRPS
jgi:hydroxymethylbilane synthase